MSTTKNPLYRGILFSIVFTDGDDQVFEIADIRGEFFPSRVGRTLVGYGLFPVEGLPDFDKPAFLELPEVPGEAAPRDLVELLGAA